MQGSLLAVVAISGLCALSEARKLGTEYCESCFEVAKLIEERVEKTAANPREIRIAARIGADGRPLPSKKIDYLKSEERYMDVTEGLCDESLYYVKPKCYDLFDRYEDEVREWYFNGRETSFADKLCVGEIENCSEELVKKMNEPRKKPEGLEEEQFNFQEELKKVTEAQVEELKQEEADEVVVDREGFVEEIKNEKVEEPVVIEEVKEAKNPNEENESKKSNQEFSKAQLEDKIVAIWSEISEKVTLFDWKVQVYLRHNCVNHPKVLPLLQKYLGEEGIDAVVNYWYVLLMTVLIALIGPLIFIGKRSSGQVEERRPVVLVEEEEESKPRRKVISSSPSKRALAARSVVRSSSRLSASKSASSSSEQEDSD